MKRIIIGIHGLRNKPAEQTLKRWWLKAIREGLQRSGKERVSIPFDMVYWADIIYETPLSENILDKDSPLYLKEPYTKDVLKKPPEHSSIRAKMMQYLEEQLDKILLNDDMSINFKGVTDRIIHRFAQDLEIYYNQDSIALTHPEDTVKKAIQDRLIEKLKTYRGYSIMLIAHSMGSIVAFDVLSRLNGQHPIHHFITLGSPLGLPVITARMFADQKIRNTDIVKPHAPECIGRQWLNMSDMTDKVALDHTLGDDYAPNSKGLSARDILVFNDYAANGRPNAHKSYGYLRTPEMAAAIDEFLHDSLKDKLFRMIKKFTGRKGMDRSVQNFPEPNDGENL